MDMNIVFDYDVYQQDQQIRNRRRRFERFDPRRTMPEAQVKKSFRFNATNIDRLIELLRPELEHETQRGNPLLVEQQVCLALLALGSQNYQWSTGLFGKTAQGTAGQCVKRFVNALLLHKDQWIKMPTYEECLKSSEEIYQRFGIRNFALGIDGMLVRFEDSPRSIPAAHDAQQYMGRKLFYGLNTQVIGTTGFRICDVDCRWYARANDARVYEWSEVKNMLESQDRFLCAGDSGYAMNHVIIKPYTQGEVMNDRTKALFNTQHARLRTVLTENIFSQLKKRFPVLRNMRPHLENAQKIIVACCMLHNMSQAWLDDAMDDEEDVPPEDLNLPPEPMAQNMTAYDHGARIRDRLREMMMRDRNQ